MLRKILHKIDREVGRHMTAKRWIVIYFAIALSGYILAYFGRWWAFLGIPMAIVGVFGLVGHARRLR